MLPSFKACATTVLYCDGNVPILATLTNLQPLDHLQQKSSGALFSCLKYKLPFIQPYRAAKEAVGDVRQQVFSSVLIRRHCKRAFIYTILPALPQYHEPFFSPHVDARPKFRSSFQKRNTVAALGAFCLKNTPGEDARVSAHVSSSI